MSNVRDMIIGARVAITGEPCSIEMACDILDKIVDDVLKAEDVVLILTRTEANRLATLLRDSAQAKKRLARQVHANDRAEVEASATSDYDLRKKVIAAKVEP